MTARETAVRDKRASNTSQRGRTYPQCVWSTHAHWTFSMRLTLPGTVWGTTDLAFKEVSGSGGEKTYL